jgi:sugar fermentation stimulation protein A
MPNRVVYEAAVRGVLPGLPGLSEVRREVAYGAEKSRIDVYGRDPQGRAVYIEAKNTTLREGAWGLFPDAVTARGAKHLRELRKVAAAGEVAVAAFFVHRSDVTQFDTAREIDAVYAEELDLAAADGVRVLPLQVGLEASLSAESASGERWQLTWTSCGLLPWVRR